MSHSGLMMELRLSTLVLRTVENPSRMLHASQSGQTCVIAEVDTRDNDKLHTCSALLPVSSHCVN